MRAVTVHEIPDRVTSASERRFLRDLQNYVETERPRLVLDCSRVLQMDRATVHLLLSCLEEAMKRNGDAKLAALRPEARATLQFVGVHRLFEMYTTTSEAIQSFRHRPAGVAPQLFENGDTDHKAEHVA
ncbi:MAG TPA: STAS domain-containing protein [Acidobacteriaceae bacterium]